MRRVTLLALLLPSFACSGSLDSPPNEGHADGGMGADAGDHSDPPAQNDAGDTPDQSPPDSGVEQTDASGPAQGCVAGGATALDSLDVVSLAVTGPGGTAPRKGDDLTITLTLHNAGSEGAMVEASLLLDGLRFDDFRAVPWAHGEVMACPGDTQLTLSGAIFLTDTANNRQFAIGTGDYHVPSVQLRAGESLVTDSAFEGADFKVATSNALLVPVLYNQAYFDEIEGQWESPEAYLREAFTRRAEIFTPTSGDPDGPGNFVTYEGGFDEMMGVRHVFKAFLGFDGSFDSGENWCYGAMDQAAQTLGLRQRWTGGGTRADQHGFDYVIALSSKMGGGVAWQPYDVQVSGFINRDVDRQEVIAVHESSHVFGAPHCDDVGNGEGGSLQGYVMCSGEKHEHYPSAFVWHSTSIAAMSAARWN